MPKNQHTQRKLLNFENCQIVKKCHNLTFKVNFLCQKLLWKLHNPYCHNKNRRCSRLFFKKKNIWKSLKKISSIHLQIFHSILSVRGWRHIKRYIGHFNRASPWNICLQLANLVHNYNVLCLIGREDKEKRNTWCWFLNSTCYVDG